MSSPDDLSSLAPVDPAPALEAQVRRVAHAELAASMGPRWQVLGRQALTRVALPAAVGVIVLGYLHWAVVAASGLLH